jgi:hypothetical protein
MKRWLAALAVMLLTASGIASAQDQPAVRAQQQPPDLAQNRAPSVSAATLQKILKFIDKIGAKQNFPPPTAQELGLSSDVSQNLPVLTIMTDDHRVYFCRSELNPADFVIWVRMPGGTVSYMFATHSDFKLNHALYLQADNFPKVANVKSPQVQDIYKRALSALAADIGKSPPP